MHSSYIESNVKVNLSNSNASNRDWHSQIVVHSSLLCGPGEHVIDGYRSIYATELGVHSSLLYIGGPGEHVIRINGYRARYIGHRYYAVQVQPK